MSVVQNDRITLERLSEVLAFSNGALSADGLYAACISLRADAEENQYRTRLHLIRVDRESDCALHEVWSEEVAGVRMLRFSPDHQKLAFLATEEDGDSICMLDISSLQWKRIAGGLAAVGQLAWQADSQSVLAVCDDASLYPSAEEGVLHIESIPQRWPWWRKRRQLVSMQATGDHADVHRLVGPVHEICSIAVADDGRIAYVEERADHATHASLVLHVLAGKDGQEAGSWPLPHSYLTTPVWSPSGDRIAYVRPAWALSLG